MNTRHQVGLFFALFFAYLVVGGREPPWNDARQIYMVAESLVQRGAIDVPTRTHIKRGDKSFAAHPFLASAVHIPGALLERGTTKLWPDSARLVRPLASHIGPAALGALVGLLFFRLCLFLGSSLSGARLGVLLVSFGTMVAVYARSPYSEITQTAAFLAYYLALLAWLERPTLRRAALFGLALGALCNIKMVFALALPGAAVMGLLRLRSLGGKPLRHILAHGGMAALGALPGLLLLLGYNYARTRSFLQTGYPAEHISGRQFGELTVIGLWGLFLSLGKSCFLYSPPLIAGLLALRHALASRPHRWFVALCATAGPVLLLYARFTFWHGDWCWGPRYSLFMVPPALLPVVFAYDDLRLRARALARALAATVGLAGVFVQVVGGIFYWDHFIRLAREAQSQWLGNARRSGAAFPDTGNDCGPCIEDLYGLNWLPAFQPIEGHFWLLRHRALGHKWERAELDAPWHRYTSLKLDLSHPYDRARIDWWLLEWKGKQRKVGVALFLVFLTGMAGATVVCLRRPRTGRGWDPGAPEAWPGSGPRGPAGAAMPG